MEGSGNDLKTVEDRIAGVLRSPGMSPWLKNSLEAALDCDPIAIGNDLAILNILLRARTRAIVDDVLARQIER